MREGVRLVQGPFLDLPGVRELLVLYRGMLGRSLSFWGCGERLSTGRRATTRLFVTRWHACLRVCAGAGASLWLERDVSGPWRFHWTDTQRAWLDEFEGDLFWGGDNKRPCSYQRLDLLLLVHVCM